MNKHYCLADFVNLIKRHRTEIEKVIESNQSISHLQLLEIFTLSKDEITAKFTYVLGSMRGSLDDQYNVLLDRLKKHRKNRIAQILKDRLEYPCIDIQECANLVNNSSTRNRQHSSGYHDYDLLKSKLFISGEARAFTIDWDIIVDKVNHLTRAFNAWNVLNEISSGGKKISYRDLASSIGIHYRALRYVLEPIQCYCLENQLPPLTILVVNRQTDKPGAGFIAWNQNDLKDGLDKVWTFNWANEQNPFEFAVDGTYDTDIIDQILSYPNMTKEIYVRVKARGMMQKLFRDALLVAYEGKCALSGISFLEALDSAHIIPWAQCPPDLKVSPQNGILMLCCLHRLYDKGIISVDDNYRVIFSNQNKGTLSMADHDFVSSLHGRKITLPKDRNLWPDKQLIRQRNT